MNIIILLAGLDGSFGSSIQTFHRNPFFPPLHSCCIVAKVGRNLFEKEIFFFFLHFPSCLRYIQEISLVRTMSLSSSCPVVPGWRSSHLALRSRHPAEAQPLSHGETALHFNLKSDGRSGPKENLCPQYLSCLTTSRSLTDKLAFDVGLQEDSTGNPEYSQRF